MRFQIFFLFVHLSTQLIGQETLTITRDDICPELFSPSKIDSTYCNYYIENSIDTIYFNNSSCAIFYQLTSPLTMLFRSKNGMANGKMEYLTFLNGSKTSYKGNFEMGYFIEGRFTTFYPNGKIKRCGNYNGGQAEGLWNYYFEDGSLDFSCFFINGVCTH